MSHGKLCLREFSEASAVLCLNVSWPKTKIQNRGAGPSPDVIHIYGNMISDFRKVGCFLSEILNSPPKT